jgi:glycosyltransferase involved in cell wall biosynthesis
MAGEAAGRLRVLHAIYDDPRNPWVAGGGAVRLFELYRRLVGEVDATLVTGSYPGSRDETIDGVRYRRVGARRPYAWSRLSYAAAAARLLRTERYDVGVFDYSVYTPLRWPGDRPIGLTIHHLTCTTARQRWGPLVGGVVAVKERSDVRRARWISVTSSATREALERIVDPRAVLIPVAAGVPDELFDLPRAEGGYLLYFGRIDWFQKGIDTLLEGSARVLRERPTLELRVAGRGKDVERARALARDLGIESRVRFLGGVTAAERDELLAGARVLLMPSRFEGFGMVAAEAMAAGVPLVASSAGSLPEVVDPPHGGVLVTPGDAAALAAAVSRLLDDDDARARLARSARASAERFRWDRVAGQHLEFLRQIQRGAGLESRPSTSEHR